MHPGPLCFAVLWLLCICHGSMAQSWWSEGFEYIYRKSSEVGQFMRDNPFCAVYECCNSNRVDMDALQRNLSLTLFGQHIVTDTIVKGLKSHYASGSNSKKPLVLSFHGPPGTGKNFVADRVADFVYAAGVESKFVHKFMGRVAFPLEAKRHVYKDELFQTIQTALRQCPRSLFIFDEVDKMPSGIFDMMSSLLDHHSSKGLNNREAVYIFLSNAGGVEISDQLLQLLESGRTRSETRLADFDPILMKSAFNVDGGLKSTQMIKSHLIDHFVPFLPLEQRHVLQCIKAEFVSHQMPYDPRVAEQILQEHVTYQWDLFSTTGCKRLSKLVGLLAD